MQDRHCLRPTQLTRTAVHFTLLLLLASMLIPTPASAQTGPPNVLLLLADDLGIEHLSSYNLGSAFPATPNITQLANDGLAFTQAWSNPYCSPTRISIHTGRYSFRTGIGEPIAQFSEYGMELDELTLPEMLQQNTPTPYATAAFGKWHMGSDDSIGGLLAPNWAGYDHFDGIMVDEQTVPFDYFNYEATVNGVSQGVSTYATTYTVDSAINWINSSSGPWFAYVAFMAPHTPFHWPPASLHSQDTAQQTNIIQYRAMVEAVDTELGRLLASIDTTNTLIVFASDNGSDGQVALPPVLPERAKGTVFQGGIRVPLVLSGDMVTGGQVDSIVNLSDLYATIGELAGATLPQGVELDTVSLVPYLTNPAAAPLRQHVYADYFAPNGPGPYTIGQQAARNAEYKYLRTTSGAEGLIHIASDPWETTNLIFGEMSQVEQDAYDELKDYLDTLLGICTLGQQGESCSSNSECCSGRCRGRSGRKKCRDLAF